MLTQHPAGAPARPAEPGGPPTPGRTQDRTRAREWAWLTVLALVVAALTSLGAGARASYGARTTADEPQYLLTALSLAQDHDLDVSDERAARAYLPFHEVALPLQATIQPDGSQINPHDPLLPVLLALPMGTGGWLAAKLTMAAMAGLLAAAVAWTAVHRLGVDLRWAVVGAALFGLSPPLAVYATQIYPELPAALAVAVAVAAALGPATKRNAATFAVAVAALPWLSVKYAPVALALGAVYALVNRRRAPRLAAAVLGVLAAAAVAYAATSRGLYGGWTPYAAGSHFTDGEATVMGRSPDFAGRSWRLVGLLVDRGFGLAVWQPAWLCAVPAVAWLVAGGRAPAGDGGPATTGHRPDRSPGLSTGLVLAAPLAVGWLVATYLALTMHGWWFPGRQVVVVLPLAVLAILAWSTGSPNRRRIVWISGLVGLLAQAFLVAEGWAHRLTWAVDPQSSIDPVLRLLRLATPDLRRMSPADRAGLVGWAVLLVVVAAATALSVRRTDRTPGDRPTGRPRPTRTNDPA